MLALHNFEEKVDIDDDEEQEERPLFLTDFMEKLVGKKARSDVIFTVPEKTSGGEREIPAHRIILAASSKLFEAMLYPPKDAEGERPKAKLPIRISVRDSNADAFLNLLHCIYTDEVEIDPSNLADLIKLAQKYQIEKLQIACAEFMEKDVTAENACELFEMAPKLLGDEEFALPFIRENMSEVLETESFLKLSKPRLEYLLKDDSLASDEVDLFKGALKWARAELVRRGEIKADAKEESKEDQVLLAKEMKDLLPSIRFPLMDMEALAFVATTKLLDDAQMLQLYQYAGSDEKEKLRVDFKTQPRSGGKRAKFTSILDTGGLIYLIGTDFGKTPYNNPIRTGKVTVKVSSSGGSSVENIGNRNPTTGAVENSFGSDRTPWISVQFNNYLLRPTEYVVCQDQDHFIQNWRFEGREKGKTEWILIKEHKNDRTITDAVPHRGVFKVSTAKMFQEFRIFVNGPSHKGQPNFDITYLEFYGYYKEAK